MTPLEEMAFARDLGDLQSQLLAYCIMLTRRRRPADAEDVMQAAQMKAWAARDQFRPGSNMRAWLFTIARNHFVSECRRDKWAGGSVEDLDLALLPHDLPSQEGPLHLADVIELLGLMPKAQADAMLAVAMGDSYEAVATSAGCEVGTIKSRVARGRAALTDAVEPEAAAA